MSKIPAINEIDANSPSQESKEVVVKATDASPDINEVQETISASATIQEVDGTRKPTISEIYKIVTDGLFESTSNWWDYAYKLSQAQINQDIIARLDKGEIGGGYSKGIDIITTTKYAVPTNANVYSALKSDSLYPKKLNDEKINGIYDFLNGIAIGNLTAYTGGTWSVNQDGKTSLTTDYLYVRLKAIFETLQILNVETIGGKMVISPAGSIKIVYVDEITITFEGIEQKAYRCYFLGEQEGEEIDNKWKVYDQAQAKSFNVKKGTYHKTGNHYLWRLVVGVSTDTVTIDGKKYHYVDLSQLVFDAGSDAPAPGDVLNQFGYRGTDDAQRQSALIFSAVDGNAPSITLYSGVNSFNLLNKEYVSFGVVNGKAFFKLYGDTYIGDRGENPNTYIKYHNGQLDIKANLDISSSIGGSSFEDYIKENAPGVDESQVINIINNSQVIKDLQNQADGAIETWFYEGEPTLKNLPAVDWTTNEIKKIHVGDLYYDQITGFAYRFTRYNDDVTPYAWNRIKDNDIVKALEAANKAQATADSKMKIFYGEIKPTDYQAGDMWVNATLAGKFDNDIARSTATSKTFDADHWVLASRYSEAIQSLLNWSNQYTTKFEDLTKTVKEQKDQSISNWFYDYEPTDSNAPANLWNTEELRKEHIGDIFYDTKNNHSYRWTGSAWVMIKDADFDEAMKKAKDAEDLADKKRQIFYSSNTPVGADRGDLWMRQVGTKTEVWVFDGTNWVKSDDKALADYSEAVNKELQGIKGQLDGKAETWYQADDPSTTWKDKTSHEGDIWYNTTDGTTQYWNGKAWEKMDIPKDVFDTIDGKSSIYVDSYADAKAGKGVISKGYDERDIWILPSDAVVNSIQYYKGDILTATANSSTFNEKHWVKKIRYVGEKELNSAVSVVQKQIDTINNTTLPNINKQFNNFVKDGILTTSEKARLKEALAALTSDKSKLLDSVAEVEKSEYLKNDTLVIPDLKIYVTALTNSFTEYKSFVKTLIADSKTNITKTELATYQNNYTNLVNAINNVRYQITLCQSQIYKNIGADITTYKYLKEAIKGHTQINGGLVFTNVIQLRKTADVNSQITAGISGLQAKTDANGNIIAGSEDLSSIAAWYGGPMVDRVTIDGVPSTWNEDTIKTDMGKKYAASIFRHDGSGYLAGGRIWWDRETGELHVNANSFIVNKDDLGLLATLFRLNLGTKYNIISAQPTAPFTNLTVLGSKTLNGITIGTPTSGGRIVIGNIVISNSGASDVVEISNLDGTKVANLGVSGGVSAYGTYTSSTGGGGGLNASVASYASIIAGNYNDADLTTIPNAYSIKALYNAIQNIDVTGQLGNYLLKTDAADTYQPKGNYLTTHQTIYGLTIQKNSVNAGTYNPKTKAATINITVPTKISELSNDSGYTKNTGTVTSIGITVPTGLSVTGSPITTKGTIAITFAKGYSIPTTEKQTNWDSAYNWYSLMTTDEETADGIINKWNEVVDFLSNISQTNTLSGIIDGINKSITDETTRAKKAETNNTTNIGINKTNISTLQSYFSNGSAKKALQLTTARKLWGNAFNGTTDINGSIVLPSGKYISIGNIKLEYDATNKALKITNTTTNEVANLYTSGGVSAYGVGTSSSSGGGLNGSVKAYADAIKLTTENLSEIASAYSVAKLYSEIQNVASAVPSISVSVPTGGNALTGATYDASTGVITFAKGTFLTAHQSLDGYVNAIAVSGSGNAVTAVTKSGKTITFTKGATYLTSHQSLSNYYTKSSVDSLLNGKSATTHTHSVKINGITKTIAASGGDAVDLGTYLTTHQSLAAYATQNWVKNEATAHNADMVDNYHASGLFTGFSISDVANKVTISIGGTSKALNLVRAFPSGVGNNFNDIATHGNSMGMSNIAAPYASSTANYQTLNGYVNPNGQTGWHHYINLSYTDSNNTATSPNMWQTQFAIKAGTTEVYVRSRAGGKISNSDAWAAPWVRLARVTDNVASASKVANALSWSGYSSGSYNGSAAKSISIPNNTNQLTNGAGFITASASISGNAGSATKLQNARTINGTSFNGTANIVTSYWGTTRKLWGNSVNGNADVNGSITIANTDGVYVQIGDVRLVYDKANTAIKVVKSDGTTAANFYATGGITAYGEGSGSSGGGGLNGSVKSYADALKLASESLSEIASAYSIKALDSRIVSLEGGSAMDVSVSGSGNAVTAISKNGTTISVTKGITFLTSHQSLDGYVNEVATSGTGNAITSVSKSGKKLTFTKGATFLTSHQSLSAYLKSADAANTYSKLGHTHSQYLTSHQSFTDLCATLGVGGSAPTDDTEFITSYAGVGGFSYTNAVNVPYKRKASALWEYIKAKSDSLYQPVGNYAAANVNGGAAKWLLGSYTNNGGQQNPNYFGTNKIGALMMNTDVEGSTGYKDWIILDCYSGNDVGGAVAIGINRQSLGAYIMRSDSSRKTWNDKATLIGTHNYKTYVYSINDIDTKLSSYATQSWVTGKGYITSASSITGNAGSATKLQNSRKFWGNAFNGTEDIGGTILPSATHRYNLGSTTYMFERTYTRYIETDNGYDLRLVCSGNELMRLSSNDNSIYFDSQGLNIKNNVSSGCSMSISEVRDTELNYGQINVIDTNGSRPKGRHLVLQYEQGNVGIGVKYPSEKLEVNGNVLVNTTNTSGDKGLKIKANSRNLLFGVGTSTKIGVYSYSDSKWLYYTDTSIFYTSGGILATGGITAYSSSDIRLKQDLRKLDYFGIIKAMGGTFGFAWKKDNTRSIGWIAQHVLCNPHLKDIVETDENGYYKINYWSPKLIATAFGAIEQVGDEVSRLKARVVFLESEVQRLSGEQVGSDKKRLGNKNINSLN